MPDTVTVAVTDRSGLMSTVALPAAGVVTGGTSSAPPKAIFWPPIIGAIVAQLANTATAPANHSVENPADLLPILIMFFSVERTASRVPRNIARGTLLTITPRIGGGRKSNRRC